MRIKIVDCSGDSKANHYENGVDYLVDHIGHDKVDRVTQVGSRDSTRILRNELNREANQRRCDAKEAQKAENLSNLLVWIEEKGGFFRKKVADKEECEAAEELRNIQDPIVYVRVFKAEQVSQEDREFVYDEESEQQTFRFEVCSELAGSLNFQMNHKNGDEEWKEYHRDDKNENVAATIDPVEGFDTGPDTVHTIFCIDQVVFRLGYSSWLVLRIQIKFLQRNEVSPQRVSVHFRGRVLGWREGFKVSPYLSRRGHRG